jgi:hypothetical protein
MTNPVLNGQQMTVGTVSAEAFSPILGASVKRWMLQSRHIGKNSTARLRGARQMTYCLRQPTSPGGRLIRPHQRLIPSPLVRACFPP